MAQLRQQLDHFAGEYKGLFTHHRHGDRWGEWRGHGQAKPQRECRNYYDRIPEFARQDTPRQEQTPASPTAQPPPAQAASQYRGSLEARGGNLIRGGCLEKEGPDPKTTDAGEEPEN